MVPLLLLIALSYPAVAGPAEEEVDKILRAFVQDFAGKSVPSQNVVFPVKLTIGPLTTNVPVACDGGTLVVGDVSRAGKVTDNGGLSFVANVTADFSYSYDFSSKVPTSDLSVGSARISWPAQVFMTLALSGGDVTLASAAPLTRGSLTAEVVPAAGDATLTLYPGADTLYATALFEPLKTYLAQSFKTIVV